MAIVTQRPRKRLSSKATRHARALIRAERRRRARQARSSRRRINCIYRRFPDQVHDVFASLAPAFTRPTYRRFVLLALAAILTVGVPTVANLLRTLGRLAPGESSGYHAFFSRDRWSPWTLARCFAAMVLAGFVPQGVVELATDDTVTEHPGDQVYGKACHRDPVRSTHSFTAYRWGHKWVVLVVLVKVPWATRRWALPLLVALYRPPGQTGRHKTPAQRARQLLRVLRRWFPGRRFVCSGDGGYGSHEFASLAARYPKRLTIVSRFHPRANPGIGDDAGPCPPDGPAGRAVPLRAVYDRGAALRHIAGAVATGAGDDPPREGRGDVLRRDHGSAALVVAELDFRDTRFGRCLAETPNRTAADSAQWPGPGGVRTPVGCRQGAGIG